MIKYPFHEIGTRLRDIRGKLSQGEFSSIFGVKQQQYNRYETGKNKPPYAIIDKISKYGAVSIDWILTGEGPQEHEPKWWEVLKNNGVVASIFNVFYSQDVFESKELKRVQKEIKDVILSNKNLAIIGDTGTGKTTILFNFTYKHLISNFKVVRAQTLGASHYRVDDFYNDIVLGLIANARLKKLDERREQARKTLAECDKRVIFTIDDAHGNFITRNVMEDMILFQQSADIRNLSIIFCGLPSESLKSLPNTQTVVVNPVDTEDALAYIKQCITRKAEGTLPLEVPPEVFRGTQNFFDVRDKYLSYIWKTREPSGKGDPIP